MTLAPRIYLDTNAFIFAIEEQSERAVLLARLFLTSREAGGPFLVTSALTLAEVLVKAYRDRNEALISRYDAAIRQSAWLNVQPIQRSTLWYAGMLRAQTRLKLPDATHLSKAFDAGCTHFLTDDKAPRETGVIDNTRLGIPDKNLPAMAPLDIPILATLLESLSP